MNDGISKLTESIDDGEFSIVINIPDVLSTATMLGWGKGRGGPMYLDLVVLGSWRKQW